MVRVWQGFDEVSVRLCRGIREGPGRITAGPGIMEDKGKNVQCVRQSEILVEQQPPQRVFVCDHAGLVINKFSKGVWGDSGGA